MHSILFGVLVAGVFVLKIKAVLFDMESTLVKYDAGSPEEVFHRVLSSLGVRRSVDEIKEAILKAEKVAKDLKSLYGKIPCEEYWHKWDSLVLKYLNVAENEILSRHIQARWFDYVECEAYSDVKDVLSELKQRLVKIGLITTAYEEEIITILRKANLQKGSFDVVVGADTVEKSKPHPDVFRYALKKLKVNPDETLFIGDSVAADYAAAENVGLKAILIRRANNTDKVFGLRTVNSLEEIFEFMG
jgi:putative hydrolase of the HAD superfamily